MTKEICLVSTGLEPTTHFIASKHSYVLPSWDGNISADAMCLYGFKYLLQIETTPCMNFD